VSRHDFRSREITALGDKGTPLANVSTWEEDGKAVTTTYPADQENNEYIWLSGRGDHPTNGRGEGDRIKISYGPSETGDKAVEVGFNEQVQLHDGRMFVPDRDKWTADDEWSYSIVMPATAATSTPGTGNVNAVDMGGWNLFVPAAGDGSHTVDLNTAVPVPAGGAGYWDYDVFANVLTASSTPGQAAFHLMSPPIESFFMKRLPVPIHAMAVFDMQPYKSERVAPRWKLRLTIHRVSTGEATILGWIQVFRKFNTTL
jgi:hypothetical protein